MIKGINILSIFITWLITTIIVNVFHLHGYLSFFIIYAIVYFLIYSKDSILNLNDTDNSTSKTIRYNVHNKTIGKFSELSISNIKDNFLINDNIVRTFYLKNGKQLSVKQLLNYFEEDIINFDQIDNILYINDIQVKAIRFKDGKYLTIGQLIK